MARPNSACAPARAVWPSPSGAPNRPVLSGRDRRQLPPHAICRRFEPVSCHFDNYLAQNFERYLASAAHGDLSPYNVLVPAGRVVFIDLPQIVDIAANPSGPGYLRRDCENLCTWFVRRGLVTAEVEYLFGDLMAEAVAAW